MWRYRLTTFTKKGICYDLSLASIRDDGDKLFTIISASKSLIVEAENQNEKDKDFNLH